MPKRMLRLIQILCALCATWVGSQTITIVQSKDLLPDIDVAILQDLTSTEPASAEEGSSDSAGTTTPGDTPSPTETPAASPEKNPSKNPDKDSPPSNSASPPTVSPKSSATPAKPKPPALAELPERFKIVDERGILGKAPPPRVAPPQLQGIAGSYAIIQAPSGASGMVKEGESVGNVKVLKIGTNRVLIEHAGKTQELKIHWGVGGTTLTPPPTPEAPLPDPKDENK